ncbi:MAG TPA: DMT family transporter [Fastidiosipila sp.]|nr:DMT family transporter [Fastidiosipila sp.]
MRYGLLSGILWGLDTVILGVALSLIGDLPIEQSAIIAPFVSTFLHDFFSAIWMLIYSAIRGQLGKLAAALKTRNGKVIMLGAILGGPVGMTGYTLAIGYIGPGYTAVISSIYPAVGALLASLFLKERFRLRQWFGLLVAIGAIIALSYTSANEVNHFLLGVGFAALSVFGWAGEGVVCAYGMRDEDVGDEQAIIIRQATSALIFAALILPVTGAWSHAIRIGSDISIMKYIIAAGLAGGFSYLFYYRSIHKIGVGKSMALNITYSAWAVLFDYLFLGHKPKFLSLVFCALIIVGGIIAAYEKAPETASQG